MYMMRCSLGKRERGREHVCIDTVNLRLTVVSGVSLSYCRAMLSRIVLAVDLATGRPLMYNIRETLSV